MILLRHHLSFIFIELRKKVNNTTLDSSLSLSLYYKINQMLHYSLFILRNAVSTLLVFNA